MSEKLFNINNNDTNNDEELVELKEFMLNNFKIWPIFLETKEIDSINCGFLRRLHPSGMPLTT
jgi:hypothetical protein